MQRRGWLLFAAWLVSAAVTVSVTYAADLEAGWSFALGLVSGMVAFNLALEMDR